MPSEQVYQIDTMPYAQNVFWVLRNALTLILNQRSGEII
jgi:hypothetical protein